MLSTQVEADILRRVIQPDHGTLSPDAARELLKLGFNEADQARMAELSRMASDATLTATDREELEGFINISHLIAFVHSKARLSLKRHDSDSHAA